jgi:alcohol dehydrogenase (cytochrome c)
LIISGSVDWCDTVTIKDERQMRRVAIGQPWTGMATLNPINMFGKESRTDGYWAGWLYATDADTGVWKWRAKSNYPIVAAIAPTAGGVVLFADPGGNFYALDSSNGQKLFGEALGGGGIAGGIITYAVNGVQKVAVAAGFTMVAWPTKPVTAKIVVLGLRVALKEVGSARPERDQSNASIESSCSCTARSSAASMRRGSEHLLPGPKSLS